MYSIKSSSKFAYSRQHSQSLYLIPHVWHVLLLCSYLYLNLWIPSAGLSTRFDELAINLVLSRNYNLQNIVFMISCPFSSILLTSFVAGSEKILYFSVFSPRQWNSFASSFMIFLANVADFCLLIKFPLFFC